MKHLKTYNESYIDNIINDINDISLELTDDGYKFNVNQFSRPNLLSQSFRNFSINRAGYGSNKIICCKISKDDWVLLSNDVIDVVLRIVEYMRQNDYEIFKKINLFYSTSGIVSSGSFTIDQLVKLINNISFKEIIIDFTPTDI